MWCFGLLVLYIHVTIINGIFDPTITSTKPPLDLDRNWYPKPAVKTQYRQQNETKHSQIIMHHNYSRINVQRGQQNNNFTGNVQPNRLIYSGDQLANRPQIASRLGENSRNESGRSLETNIDPTQHESFRNDSINTLIGEFIDNENHSVVKKDHSKLNTLPKKGSVKCAPNATGQFPYALDCKLFLNCWKGRGYIQNCAPGTLFNPDTLECDYPDKVICTSYQSQADIYEKEPTISSRMNFARSNDEFEKVTVKNNNAEDIYKSDFVCVHGKIYPHPTDCTKFFYCNNEMMLAQDCVSGMVFYPELGFCVPAVAYNCTSKLEKYISVSETTTKPIRSQQTRKPHGQQNKIAKLTEAKCPDGHSGLLPHPTDCTKFLNCANGRTFVQDCGPGTVFNPVISACDWPYNVKCQSDHDSVEYESAETTTEDVETGTWIPSYDIRSNPNYRSANSGQPVSPNYNKLGAGESGLNYNSRENRRSSFPSAASHSTYVPANTLNYYGTTQKSIVPQQTPAYTRVSGAYTGYQSSVYYATTQKTFTAYSSSNYGQTNSTQINYDGYNSNNRGQVDSSTSHHSNYGRSQVLSQQDLNNQDPNPKPQVYYPVYRGSQTQQQSSTVSGNQQTSQNNYSSTQYHSSHVPPHWNQNNYQTNNEQVNSSGYYGSEDKYQNSGFHRSNNKEEEKTQFQYPNNRDFQVTNNEQSSSSTYHGAVTQNSEDKIGNSRIYQSANREDHSTHYQNPNNRGVQLTNSEQSSSSGYYGSAAQNSEDKIGNSRIYQSANREDHNIHHQNPNNRGVPLTNTKQSSSSGYYGSAAQNSEDKIGNSRIYQSASREEHNQNPREFHQINSSGYYGSAINSEDKNANSGIYQSAGREQHKTQIQNPGHREFQITNPEQVNSFGSRDQSLTYQNSQFYNKNNQTITKQQNVPDILLEMETPRSIPSHYVGRDKYQDIEQTSDDIDQEFEQEQNTITDKSYENIGPQNVSYNNEDYLNKGYQTPETYLGSDYSKQTDIYKGLSQEKGLNNSAKQNDYEIVSPVYKPKQSNNNLQDFGVIKPNSPSETRDFNSQDQTNSRASETIDDSNSNNKKLTGVWPPPYPAQSEFKDQISQHSQHETVFEQKCDDNNQHREPLDPHKINNKPSGFIEKATLNLDQDCNNKFECEPFKCIPLSLVCDGTVNCQNGKDEMNCSKDIDLFRERKKSRLMYHDVEKWLSTRLDICAKYCLTSKTFTCRSFSYRFTDETCFLSDSNIGLSGSVVPSEEYDYYEMKSQSITCDGMFQCDNLKCINLTDVCNGYDNCNDRSDEKRCSNADLGYEIRLAGSNNTNEGRIEVKVFGRWGMICDDQFDMREAEVACKELGFPLGAMEVRQNSYFYPNSNEIEDSNDTLILMDDLKCFGNETSLKECDFNGWGIHDCLPQEIAGVVCKTPTEVCPNGYWKCDTSKECIPLAFLCDNVNDCDDSSDETDKNCKVPVTLRLVNGSNEMEGRVEVKRYGVWGTMCDDDFNDRAATVICRQLGFKGLGIAKKEGAYGPGSGPIWLDQVYCFGNESSIELCMHDDWGQTNCGHEEDAGVICNSELNTPNFKPKLPKKTYSIQSIIPQTCGNRLEDSYETPPSVIMARVVAGSVAKKGDYPWQASIRVRGQSKSSHWCGAVIITHLHVLTAAHCLIGFSKSAYFIRAGDYDSNAVEGTEVEAYIEDYYIHEEFRKGQHMNNDIAIIKLKSGGLPLSKHIQAICLPEKNARYETGKNCTISGWGSTQSGKSAPSTQLRAGWIPLQPNDVCRMPEVYGNSITDGMICAGSLDEGVDSCDGDSGGPLACMDDNGAFTLYGITSWGQHCGYANKPGVYVKVAHYRDWIEKKIEDSLMGR